MTPGSRGFLQAGPNGVSSSNSAELAAGFARNRISSAASMASPPCLVRADGAARLRRSASPSADTCRFAEIFSLKQNSQRLLNRLASRRELILGCKADYSPCSSVLTPPPFTS